MTGQRDITDRLRGIPPGWVDTALGAEAADEIDSLRKSLHTCVNMLGDLVEESGRGVDYDAEDPFRMGEWFEQTDLDAIAEARAKLKTPLTPDTD